MKYSKLVMLILIVLPIFITSVTAQTELDYVYKLGSTNRTEISRPCFNSANGDSGGWCSNETKCQLTITDPQNFYIVSGGNMTNQISRYNYTLPILSIPGVYKCDMACTDHNLTGADTFFFGLNNAGSDYNTNGSVIFILGILLGLMILFSLCAYFLNDWLRMSFLGLAILMLPVTLWVCLDIARNTFMGAAVINIISGGFIISTVGFVAMLLYFLIILLSQLKIRHNTVESKGSPLYWKKKQDYADKHKNREFE